MSQPARNRSEPGLGQLGASETEVPDWFARYFEAALSNPLLYVPKAFETWMTDRVAVAGLDVPIGQIVGFSRFAPQIATAGIDTATTSSPTYTDITPVGPTITGLPDGNYVVLLGALIHSSAAGSAAWMSVSVNGGTPSDDDAAAAATADFVGASAFSTHSLAAGGNNSLTAKYRADATGSFLHRRLVVLRVGNS